MRSPEKEIEDPEEVYILKILKSMVHDVHCVVPLFLVGDWPRSRILKYQAFHFEALCFSTSFDYFSEKLRKIFLSLPEDAPFVKPSTLKSLTADDAYPYGKCIFRLTSKNQKKYKISLEIIFQDDLFLDLKTRDFSLNSLYFNIVKDCFIQDSNVNFDFENLILRTIRTPKETFTDQINLFFRLFEYQARFNLKIDREIFEYFQSVDASKILKVAAQTQRNNFKSSSNKFFSKHYLWQMLRAMTDLNAIGFFRLDYKAGTSFHLLWKICVEILFEMEKIFSTGLDDFILSEYPNGCSQVFYTKARLFCIVLIFFIVDPQYSLNFMSIFIYNGKEVSEECKNVLKLLSQLLLFYPESSKSSKMTQTIESLNSVNFDSSKWGLYVVIQAIFKAHSNGLGFLSASMRLEE